MLVMQHPARPFVLFALLLAFVVSPAGAQSPAETADALFDAEDWAGAAAAYEAIWEAAEDTSKLPARIPARAANAHLRLGHRDLAIRWLERGVELGLPLPYLDGHPGLSELRDHPGFAELREVAERKTFPCRHQERYRDFDFWIGSWDVYDTAGRKAGNNTIVRASEGCMLYESWTNASGVDGHSLNYVDPATDEWVQVWMGADGSLITGRGGLEGNGAMFFLGEHVLKTGERRPFSMHFTPQGDGSVRQLLKESTDGGKTWAVWFDGRYLPAGSEPPGTEPLRTEPPGTE